MLHMKQLNRKKTRFSRFDILVIEPIAEVYDESNERQLCWEIGKLHVYQTAGNLPHEEFFQTLKIGCDATSYIVLVVSL